MQIFGLKLICLSIGLLIVYTGLWNWPTEKPTDYNIIDAEWEEINEHTDSKLDVFI